MVKLLFLNILKNGVIIQKGDARLLVSPFFFHLLLTERIHPPLSDVYLRLPLFHPFHLGELLNRLFMLLFPLPGWK